MHKVESARPSPQFLDCLATAGVHLERLCSKAIREHGYFFRWLKSDVPQAPCLEHISFFLGNQVFFVRLYDVEQRHAFPGTPAGLRRIAEGYEGHACLMPMRRTIIEQTDGAARVRGARDIGMFVPDAQKQWQPVRPGWGLVGLDGETIEPPALVTNQRIAVTDWELHDFAVQIVREQLQQEGKQILSWNSDPDVHPDLWFEEGGLRAWVMVQANCFPEPTPEHPDPQLEQRIKANIPAEFPGYFAAVGFAQQHTTRIFRGEGTMVNFRGLRAL
ncbi:MAG: hypothetical protein IK051_10500 [Rhodocyclaceae bacterium]|nr:hypothetical protein [Rhodocyclaceae bacterium]